MMTRCLWSVWNRFTPQHSCGRRTVDGIHCATHAKMAAKIDAANDLAKAEFLSSSGPCEGQPEPGCWDGQRKEGVKP